MFDHEWEGSINNMNCN